MLGAHVLERRMKREKKERKKAPMSVREKLTYLCTFMVQGAAEFNSQKPLGSDWPDVGGLGR